jgi:serine/threonine protein kinase
MSNESSPDSLVGVVTGGYRVLSKIGSGTMGHVYDAEDVKSGRHVALKVLRKSHLDEMNARFVREGKTLALLSHPNIVQLVDMGQLDDGTLFLATELVPGGSLRDLMNHGPIEHRRALRLVRQLLDALQAAHDLGVVHRDIKPENVMIADGDFVKVLDFGVAKLLQDTVAGLGEANLTSVGFSVFGSALYISPESVTGQKLDGRSDIYSTGAMLFEMLAGRPVFDNEDPTAILRAQAFDPPPTLQQAAPTQTFTVELEALLARALAKKPEERYGSAADMIAAVDAVLQGMDPPSSRQPSVEEARPASSARAPSLGGAQPGASVFARLATQPPVSTTSKRKRTLAIAGIGAVMVLAIILIATRDKAADASKKPDAAQRQTTGPTKPDQAASVLSQGHDQFAQGNVEGALAAYERALRAKSALGADPKLRANLTTVLDGKDVLATIVALDLLSSLTPPASDLIASYASNGKLQPARHRALMLAERDGVDAKIDRVQGLLLDLQQATSCEDRKRVIQLLALRPDRRALPALKRMRAVKCVEPDATDAIARIETSAE